MFILSDIKYKEQLLDEKIEREMYKLKAKVLSGLSNQLAHYPFSIKQFATEIAYGYFESYEYAEILAQELDLGKLELLAILEEVDAFKEQYLKEIDYNF